jgi:hypothetical protein
MDVRKPKKKTEKNFLGSSSDQTDEEIIESLEPKMQKLESTSNFCTSATIAESERKKATIDPIDVKKL